ncbi:hypothetical protein KEM48_011229 [Puccinia striiformis f. sp. tritici PST-130]|nr:hypothetical protein KEM48_011229 [Puccinia striiformis f. sp. tritici PST-130]
MAVPGPSAPMVLMNIVLARGDKVENTIYNAQTIGMKYSISAEYLTTSAWKCQTKQFLGILKKHSRNLSELNRARGKEPRVAAPHGDDLVEFGARHPFSIGLAPTRVLPGCEPANEARRGLLSPIGARGPFHSARGERFGGPIGSASSAINGGGTAPTKTTPFKATNQSRSANYSQLTGGLPSTSFFTANKPSADPPAAPTPPTPAPPPPPPPAPATPAPVVPPSPPPSNENTQAAPAPNPALNLQHLQLRTLLRLRHLRHRRPQRPTQQLPMQTTLLLGKVGAVRDLLPPSNRVPNWPIDKKTIKVKKKNQSIISFGPGPEPEVPRYPSSVATLAEDPRKYAPRKEKGEFIEHLYNNPLANIKVDLSKSTLYGAGDEISHIPISYEAKPTKALYTMRQPEHLVVKKQVPKDTTASSKAARKLVPARLVTGVGIGKSGAIHPLAQGPDKYIDPSSFPKPSKSKPFSKKNVSVYPDENYPTNYSYYQS